jgi:hypothetical protein
MLLNTSPMDSSSWQLVQDSWTLVPGPVCVFASVLLLKPAAYYYHNPATADELERFSVMIGKFREVYHDFTGPIAPETSVRMQLDVINRTTIDDTGAFISHKGNKEWL